MKQKLVSLECPNCFRDLGFFHPKKVKPMVCPFCKVGIKPSKHVLGRAHKRNYPEGYFD